MLALALAILGISTSAVLVRLSDASSSVIAFYRVLFTVSLVAPFALRGNRAAFGRISGRDWLAALGAGIALAVHFVVWFESLAWTTVAASATLVQTQPLFVVIGALLLLDERVDRRVVAGIAVAMVGVVVMSVSRQDGGLSAGGDAMIGTLLAVGGALMSAVYLLTGRSLRQRTSTLPYVTIVYTACAFVLFVVVVTQGRPLFDYPPAEWLLFAAMAVGPGLLGHTVINWALEHLESTVVSVSLLGEPVGATLLAAVFLSEIPTPLVVLGGLAVLIGIGLTSTSRTARRAQQSDGTERGDMAECPTDSVSE
jgi:drug/metabolite transporter (DMT)-like permease